MRVVGAVVGTLAVASMGLAPSAAAADAQSQQWYLGPMQTEQMWKVTKGEGVKIAVLDTGVNPNTPSLKGQVLADEVPEPVAYGATDDYHGHGTTMAELMVGTGAGGGIQGLAPGAKVVPYRVQMMGLHTGEEFDKETPAGEALRAAADSDAKIINMSLGGMTSKADQDAVEYAASKGKLLVASVGNEGAPDAPAMYPYVLGVGAADANYKVSKFSKESSDGYTDLVAPGEAIPKWCDETFRSYCQSQGTSQATALVSASAALIWSAHPDWTVNQVTRALLDTASRGWPKDEPSMYAGYGFIRPRVVLADPGYDPGAPDVDPLAEVNGGDLLAKAGARDASDGGGTGDADNAGNSSSAPSAPASGASQAPEKGSADGTSTAGSDAEAAAADDSSSNTLWIALGAAAAVIVIGGAGAAVLRARRAR
ncbi:S8 family serine peptidase [Streptomyces glaucescens]|uniref:S8 family serine peptidase n=1 Tax=Streptomyces glaucescens TaxID=1907 RepID=UPI002448719B|nr:S8 family serine peptidase [Streptomyces glaucescens]